MYGFTYYVDGLDLDIPWNLVQGTLYRPAVSVRSVSTVIPGRSGFFAATSPTLFEAPTLTLVFSLQKLPNVTLEEAVNNLVGAFTRSGVIPIRRVSEGLTTYADARLVSISEPGNFFVGAVATMTVTVSIPGVYFRSELITTAGMNAQFDTTVQLASLYGGTGPITDATVRIKGPGQLFSIYDVNTRTGVTYNGSLNSNEYVFIDTGRLTARRDTNAGSWESGGTNVNGLFDYPSAGPLQLWPTPVQTDPTNRPISVSLTGQGRSSETQVTIRARKAYL